MNGPNDDASGGAPRLARPFGLADAMILVAAAAIGIQAARPIFAHLGSDFFPQIQGVPISQATRRFALGATAAYPMIASLSAALIVIRLRTPGPPLRRLARQPGFVACVAAVAPILVALLSTVPVVIKLGGSSPQIANLSFFGWLTVAHECGCAVIGAWTTQSLLVGRRPERSWIDRFGRTLGWAWIATLALEVVANWIYLVGL